MTLLVKFGDDKLREFPVSVEHKLGDEFLTHPAIGSRGEVYGYIINRRPEFRHKFYGWALPR